MLTEERERLHLLPCVAHTVCFGETRKVDRQATISVGSAIYSVPSALVGERVWARAHGCELIIMHADSPDGPREVARHGLTTPGPATCSSSTTTNRPPPLPSQPTSDRHPRPPQAGTTGQSYTPPHNPRSRPRHHDPTARAPHGPSPRLALQTAPISPADLTLALSFCDSLLFCAVGVVFIRFGVGLEGSSVTFRQPCRRKPTSWETRRTSRPLIRLTV